MFRVYKGLGIATLLWVMLRNVKVLTLKNDVQTEDTLTSNDPPAASADAPDQCIRFR